MAPFRPLRPSRRRALLALALVALPGLAGCGEPPAEPLSVVLVTLDTTRRDVFGCYGAEFGVTPELDALAPECLLYENAYTVAPITLPSHASILTGLYPLRHSVRDNGIWPLPTEARTLAEMAQGAGFQTAAFVGSIVLDERFGLDQGFERYSGSLKEQTSVYYEARPAREVVDEALSWLRVRDRQRPFFLWVHLYDPHAPYEPPEEFRGDFQGSRLYLGEIASVDHEVGRLVAQLRSQQDLDSSLLVVTSDHGEAFGEHGEFTHGPYCWESTLNIPLFVRYPDGYRAGERSDELVSLVDLFPTMAEAMALEVPDGIDGASLFHGQAPPGRGVYFESYMGYVSFGWSQLAGWLDGGGKYLHSSEPQFFDVWEDPKETEDLTRQEGSEPPPLERYRRAIAEVAARPALAPVAVEPLEQEVLEELRGLGYTSAGLEPDEVPHPLAETDRPSPERMLLQYQVLLKALDDMHNQRHGDAIRILKRVADAYPDNWFAIENLCASLVQAGRAAEALPYLERVVSEGPQQPWNYQNLAAALSAKGRDDEAIEALERGLALAPRSRAILRSLVSMLERAGRGGQAAPFRERLRELGG